MDNIIFLDGEIEEGMFQYFIDTLNSFEQKEGTIVYLSTEGGNLDLANAFVDVLEKYKITLIATGKLMSAGVYIYLKSHVNKECLTGTFCMFHHSRLSNLSIDTKTKTFSKQDQRVIDSILGNENDFFNSISDFLEVTVEEQKLLDNGEDLYFSRERLKKAEKNALKFLKLKK